MTNEDARRPELPPETLLETREQEIFRLLKLAGPPKNWLANESWTDEQVMFLGYLAMNAPLILQSYRSGEDYLIEEACRSDQMLKQIWDHLDDPNQSAAGKLIGIRRVYQDTHEVGEEGWIASRRSGQVRSNAAVAAMRLLLAEGGLDDAHLMEMFKNILLNLFPASQEDVAGG